MSIEAFFPHAATIERRVQTGSDAYNNPVYTWSTVAAAQPCRFIERAAERIHRNGVAESAVVTVYRLLLGSGTDVAERDRATITLENGSQTGPWLFGKLRKPRSRGVHHISIELEAVT